MVQLTADEVLAKQRQEATAGYAKKIADLTAEIKDLELKRNNSKEVFNELLQGRIAEINTLEEEVRLRLSQADELKDQAARALKDANAQLNIANLLRQDLADQHNAHNERVESHIAASTIDREDIAARKGAVIEIEKNAAESLKNAQERIIQAENKEKEIELKADKLVHISANINDDISIQKDILSQNQSTLDNLLKERTDLMNISNKVNFDRNELEQLRKDLDNQTARLSQRKVELDQRAEAMKTETVKIELANTRLKEREDNIKVETGKLHELKNTVETLMKLKEKES